jgi:hypothetical protein
MARPIARQTLVDAVVDASNQMLDIDEEQLPKRSLELNRARSPE